MYGIWKDVFLRVTNQTMSNLNKRPKATRPLGTIEVHSRKKQVTAQATQSTYTKKKHIIIQFCVPIQFVHQGKIVKFKISSAYLRPYYYSFDQYFVGQEMAC